MIIAVTFDPGCGVDQRTAALVCAALDVQAKEFCDRWGADYGGGVAYYSTDVLLVLQGDDLARFIADTYLVTVQTTMDIPGALGYHDDQAGVMFARVLWQGVNTWATMSHEILELLGDRTCDKYADMGNGKEQAVEACDRVEADSYTETGTIGPDSIPVQVSNYLLPSAFVPNSTGPWDRMGRLTAWNGQTTGGYMIVQNLDGTGSTEVFAETREGQQNAEAKKAKAGGRLARRLA